MSRDCIGTNDLYRVHYEFPGTSHDHKSMLLRGVKLPPPALDGSDIAMIKSKGQRSGRSWGGVPLGGRNNYNNYNNNGGGRGGRRDQFNYGPGDQRPRQDRPDRGSQYGPPGTGNGYHGRGSYQPPPQTWQPPPPGYPGFGIGLPPPPPAHAHGGGRPGDNYGQNYQQGYAYNQQAPPPGNYSRQQQHYQGGPPGHNGRDYRSYGGDRGGGYRGSRDYNR